MVCKGSCNCTCVDKAVLKQEAEDLLKCVKWAEDQIGPVPQNSLDVEGAEGAWLRLPEDDE